MTATEPTEATEPTAEPQPPPPQPDPIAWHVPEGQSGYSWPELQTMSETLSKSSLVPAAYRQRPANIIMVAIIGQELGWGLATAMRFVHVIDGRPTVSPEAMLALVRRAGHSVGGESDNSGATVRGRRRDNGDEMTCTFTIDDAKTAKLLHKDNWQLYPAAMCWARALAMLCRRLFPDVLLGAAYVPEEMGADVNEHGEVIEATATEAEPEPDYHALGWRDADHVDAARRATKTLLDQLGHHSKVKVRAASGPLPPMHQYSWATWAARHKLVVVEAQAQGLAAAFESQVDPALAAYEPEINQEPATPADEPEPDQDPETFVAAELATEPAAEPLVLDVDGDTLDLEVLDDEPT